MGVIVCPLPEQVESFQSVTVRRLERPRALGIPPLHAQYLRCLWENIGAALPSDPGSRAPFPPWAAVGRAGGGAACRTHLRSLCFQSELLQP